MEKLIRRTVDIRSFSKIKIITNCPDRRKYAIFFENNNNNEIDVFKAL